MKKEIIKEIITNFQTRPFNDIFPREQEIPLDLPKVITVCGVRRSGKTYLLFHAIHRLIQEGLIPKEQIVMINFEDERLSFQQEELDLIIQAYQELFPQIPLNRVYFFFDEIQNITSWEKFIRRMLDMVSQHIFITGSNAKALSQDISTSLRGRNYTIKLFPLSFNEYLSFKKITPIQYQQQSQAITANAFTQFLVQGGFPELNHIKDSFHQDILQDYYQVMLFKDLVERYELFHIPALKYFIKRLAECTGKPFSVHKIYLELKSQGYKIGKNYFYELIDYIESIYLFVSVKKYSKSTLKQELSEKKFYMIDTGLLNAVSFQFQNDYGKLFETIIGLEFIKKGLQVFYYKEKKECDFIVFKEKNLNDIVQVCYSIQDPDTQKREIEGLIEACNYFSSAKGTIITMSENRELLIQNIQIRIISASKYFLS